MLSCQLAFASVAGAFTSSLNDVHQSFLHSQDVEHHHHDAFSTHNNDKDGDTAHQHFTDSFQTIAIVPQVSKQAFKLEGERTRLATLLAPPDVYLDGLLRPPQTYF